MWQSALITRKNTRSGAIPFSAPTNMVPRIEITDACGTTRPRTRPMINPQMIRLIRLMLFHFLIKSFIVFFGRIFLNPAPLSFVFLLFASMIMIIQEKSRKVNIIFGQNDKKKKKVCEKIVILNKKISFRGCAYAVRVV